MRRALPFLVSAAALLSAAPGLAQPTPTGPPVVIDATLSGQPIRPPAGDLRITISEVILPVGGGLPAHKHPYPRLVRVLAGQIRIRNLDTGAVREAKAGDWMVDAVEQWHDAKVIGDEPVRLMTIDEAPPGAAATILRGP